MERVPRTRGIHRLVKTIVCSILLPNNPATPYDSRANNGYIVTLSDFHLLVFHFKNQPMGQASSIIIVVQYTNIMTILTC